LTISFYFDKNGVKSKAKGLLTKKEIKINSQRGKTMKKNLVLLMCIAGYLVLTPAVSTLSSETAQTEGSQVLGLFTDSSISGDINFSKEPTIIRTRYVNISFDLLTEPDGRPFAGAHVLGLNLFSDVLFTAIRDREELNPTGGFSWLGHIHGVEHSHVTLVVKDGIMVGNITLPRAFYQVRYAGNGVHAVHQIDQSAFPNEADPIEISSSDRGWTPDELLADDGLTIDVLVAYTADARAAAGGTTAMNSLINLAVSETNTTYLNSGIAQRLNLVHTTEVTYTETGDMYTDLPRLANTSDGYMDNVHSLRDTYCADEVVLIIANGGSYCGLAYMMTTVSTSFASSAFAVVDDGCATGYYSFGHEMGHNMGAHHDWYVNSSISPYPYNHGYVNSANLWRTVMAYNTECADGGVHCTRLPYWSNPDVLYGGNPMGVPEGTSTSCVTGVPNPNCDADNRKTLNNTAFTVANFRQSCAPSQLRIFDGHDFDGDTTSDISLYRPTNGMWYIKDGTSQQWGAPGDIPVQGNYDLDATTEIAIFRPSNGLWYISGISTTQWGASGDIPVPHDYSGDGVTDIAVWRPSDGIWYVNGVGDYQWGQAGDYPVPGDYNGDGADEVAVWRPAEGAWYISGVGYYQWGALGDIPVPADYNGDGKTDLAVFRATIGIWYIQYMGGGSTSVSWGMAGDIPVPGDYDGDGTTDVAIWRPSDGLWYIYGNGTYQYGQIGDTPLVR
jgi:hypothetical protein